MNEIVKSYFLMPEANLLGLIKMDFKELLKIELEIVNDWIKNKKCDCSMDIKIQQKQMSLKCNHIKTEKERKTKKIKEKINFKTKILNIRKLGEFQRIRNSFYTI